MTPHELAILVAFVAALVVFEWAMIRFLLKP